MVKDFSEPMIIRKQQKEVPEVL